MVDLNLNVGSTFIFLLLSLFLQFHSGESDLRLNYYEDSCPRAEEIVKEQVKSMYEKKYNTVFAQIRMLFHDCFVRGCDASLLLDDKNGMISEKGGSKNSGLRYFKVVSKIKEALEKECPMTVSCADVLALTAAEGAFLVGGRLINVKTGRKDALKSYASSVDEVLPNNNDSVSAVLSMFESIGIDTEGTVALLGAHSVGRTHCTNIKSRLYPSVHPSLNSSYAEYLKDRCPLESKKAVEYARNDPYTPAVLDNRYYKNLLEDMGLLVVDQELIYDDRTHPIVERMADDNDYFLDQFARAMLILSENNPLTGEAGQIRKDCRYVNK